MQLHRGFLNRISFIIIVDLAAVTGCELDVGFLCDKATVVGEDITRPVLHEYRHAKLITNLHYLKA